MQIDVIIPAYNEADSIGRVIRDIPPGLVREVTVVSNASTDNTEEYARIAGATVLRETRRGYGWACLRGIEHVSDNPPDIMVFLDADYSDRPDEMTDVVAPILNDEADFVVGSRMLGNREPGAMLPQALIGNRVACFLMRRLWGVRYSDLGPFRAIRFSDLQRMRMSDKTYGWTIEMQIKAARMGLRIAEVPVSYRKRIGQSKISGTVRGALMASVKILWTIAYHAFIPHSRRSLPREEPS